MKQILAFLLFTNFMFSQATQPQLDRMNFEPGELIVKLKDNVNTNVTYMADGKAMSDFNIAKFLGIENKIGISKIMFHKKAIESSILNKQNMKAIYAAKVAANPKSGYVSQEPMSMKNVFVLKTTEVQENILQLIDQVKNNPNVEFAEPNYRFSIQDYKVEKVITAEQASALTPTSPPIPSTPNDPLYTSQTNIIATNINDVWGEYSTGNGSQMVAILDTGVDYTHPDLAANIWSNAAEANGVAGFDDDGNGYIDDFRGWDFINVDNTPLDDNLHGTHVAGIVGAVGNNGIGIAGAAWNVKLMPIKVFQSTGQGNSTTIAAGVEYASNNGATVLNMSFGSYAESSTLKLALENAYATAILVASAGNNGICIGPGKCPDGKPSAPHYPSAYNFVLGVEDNATYSCYDQDGPVATSYANLLNYELTAPGSQIMSTIPNGGYGNLTGTSMAAPLVAGALALYKQLKPNDSKELMFGNLINTSTSYIDLLAAIQVVPTPQLAVLSVLKKDTINGQNGNGIIQSGETVEILPLIRNYWGPTTDVRVGIAFAPYEDQTKATIVQNEIHIGSISAYATLQNLQESLKVTIANNVANNVEIKFILTAWSGPNHDYPSSPLVVVINVKNSTLLTGLISSNMTLTPDKEYLVTSNVVVSGNAVLTILPGTILQFSDNIAMSFIDNSKLICEGTKENRIKIISEGSAGYQGFVFNSVSNTPAWHTIKFTEFTGINMGYPNWFLKNSKSYLVEDVIFTNSYSSLTNMFSFSDNVSIIRRVNITNIGSGACVASNGGIENSVSSGSNLNSYIALMGNYYSDLPVETIGNTNYIQRMYDVNYINNTCNWSNQENNHLRINSTSNTKPFKRWNAFGNYSNLRPDLTLISLNSSYVQNSVVYPKVYLGSAVETIFDNRTWHFLNGGGASPSASSGAIFDWSQAVTTPYESTHGIVWKIKVNGKDAQDEYALMDPIGVGTHEFKVYFNKAMKTTVNPQISYGVIYPYNQKIITEPGSWSADGKVYTVNHVINIGAADGISRIRVQDAQDLDYFSIPIEMSRFNMLVQSAGSASVGFFATPGLGKIKLEWESPNAAELNDALGYDMYRYVANANGTFTNPVKINTSLIIEDTNPATTGVYYTDFNVTEGQTYFYKYKILRTSLEGTDYSNTVSASPLTSLLGDSNGDFSVNVLDLVHDVDYILGNNPTPFISLAADVNADHAINVLDIVGTVDIILNPSGSSNTGTGSTDMNFYPSNPVGYATFSWEGNDLYVESDHNIGGLQLAFNPDFEYVLSSELGTIERLDYTQEDTKIVMLFSFNNTSISSGKTKLLTRVNASQNLNIEKAVVGTTGGSKLTAVFKNSNLEDIDAPLQSDNLEFVSMIPNPTNGLVGLSYFMPEEMDGATARVYDMIGRLVHIQQLDNKKGSSETQMQLSELQAGNYIVLISAEKNGGIKHIANKTLIIK